MAPTGKSIAGIIWTRHSGAAPVWEVITEPSADAFFPTIISVHAFDWIAKAKIAIKLTNKYFFMFIY